MDAKSLSMEYVYETILSELTNAKSFKQTSFFSPIPNVDLSFCFEYFFRIIPHPLGKKYDVVLFQLKLVRRPTSEIQPSWLMDVDVEVITTYSDSDITFKKYLVLPSVKIYKVFVIDFEDVVTSYENMSCIRMIIEGRDEDDNLNLYCRLKIWDDSKLSLPTLWNETHLLAEFKQFANDFSSIYESDILSDIKFKVDEKSIPAHKAVVVAHSPVFLKMLTSDFQESQTNVITVTDSNHYDFTTFIKYLYSGEIEDNSWSSMKELYKLADKYDVSALKRQCQRIILSSLSVPKVCEVLIIAYEFSDDNLKKAAINFAVDNIKDVMSQENWKEFVESYPCAAYDVVVNFAPK